MHFLKNLKFWFPVAVYSGIIFGISSIADLKGPGLPFQVSDKLLHVFEYIPFGFLLSRALASSLGMGDARKLWVLSIAFSFLYGFTDEVHQAFVPGREADFGDLMADTLGGLAGAGIFLVKRKIKNVND